MPTTEAQKRASKAWRQKNKERANEINRVYRQANLEKYKEYQRTASSVYYYKHREEILEKWRNNYLKKTKQETLEDLTDTESVDSSSDSTISNLTDWSTVATETVQQSLPEPVEIKPEAPKTVFVHPLFKP